MDRDTSDEFNRVWKRLEKADEDRLQLVRVTEAVKTLTRKLDRFSFVVSTFALTVLADVISHYIK